MKELKVKNPKKPISYIFADKTLVILLAVSGTLFNVGLLALPIFEGLLAQTLYDIIGGKKVFSDMLIVAGAFFVTMLFVQLFRYLKRYYVRKMANNTASMLRKFLYRSIINKKQVEIEEEDIGGVMAKGISDIDAVSEGMRKLVTEFFDTGVLLAAYSVIMLTYDVKLAVCCIALIPLTYSIAVLLRKPIVRFVNDYKRQTEKLNNITLERIENETMFRVFSVEELKNRDYSNEVKQYEKKAIKANITENAMQPIYKVIMLSGVILIAFYGAKNVIGSGSAIWNIASFTTFNLCFVKMADKVSKGAKTFNAVQKATVSWERILPFLEEKEDTPATLPYLGEHLDIVVDNVSFAYNENSGYIVKNLSFTIGQGEKIGITGKVASGKSTIGRLFLNERRYEGNIDINGIELRNISDKERIDIISYLGHRYELINATVEENICLGDKGDADKLLETVCLKDELKPSGGKNAVVGNNGIMLSGGQQARLALARTLFHAKRLIILDDVFSSVDKATEKAVLSNMRPYLKDKSLILITHRVYNFENFDKVIFTDGEKTIVSTHSELMNNAAYRELYDAQKEGGNEK